VCAKTLAKKKGQKKREFFMASAEEWIKRFEGGKKADSNSAHPSKATARREQLPRFPDDCSMKLAEFLFHVFQNPERVSSNPVGWGAA
jgi:uncharacterized damage-inducible protein DinB